MKAPQSKPISIVLVAASLLLGGQVPAFADDAERILRGVLGVGAGILLNEMQRERGTVIRRLPRHSPKPKAGRRPVTTSATALSPRQMFAAQVRLSELGYDLGEPDGQSGARTREAVRRYQADMGFPATGVLTAKQHRVLLNQAQLDGPRQADFPDDTASSQDDKLPREDMAEVQRSLSELGFDVGEADGVAGSRTGRAIAQFLQDRGHDPYQTSARTAYDLITAEAGGQDASAPSLASAPAAVALDYLQDSGSILFDWDTTFAKHRKDESALGRELVRRILAVTPGLLDDDKILADWLQTFAFGTYATWPAPEIKELYGRFSNGTEFEKETALADLRTFLKAQATQEPIEFVRIRFATVGKYDFEKEEFPLIFGDADDLANEMTLDWADRPSVNISVDDMPFLGALPFPKRDAERMAATLDEAGSRIVYVVARMTLPQIVDDGNAFRSKASLHSINIHLPPKGEKERLGRLLSSVPLKGQSAQLDIAESGDSSLDKWRKLGVVPVDGRILFSQAASDESIRNVQRAMELIGLVKGGALDLKMAMYFSKEFLSQDKFYQFLGNKFTDKFVYDLGNDPFQQKDLMQRFTKNIYPGLASRAPGFPVPVRIVWRVSAGEYDFSSKAFPLDHRMGTDKRDDNETVEISPYWLGNIKIATDVLKFPTEFKLDEQAARDLHQRFRRKSSTERDLFAALDLDINSMTQNADPFGGGVPGNTRDIKNRINLSLAATTAHPVLKIYEDPARKRLVAEIPLAVKASEPAIAAKPKEPVPAANTGGSAPAKAAATTKGPVYDIAGVRLGMKLDEAVAAAKLFVGDGFMQLDEERSEPAFAKAVVFLRGAAHDPLEKITIFYDSTEAGQVVTSIGRYLELKDFLSEDDAQKALLPRLKEKYGTFYDGGYNDFNWAADQATAGKFKSGEADSCRHSNFQNFYDKPQGAPFPFPAEMLPCGEVLSASIWKENARFFLTDTGKLAEIRKRFAASQPTRPPPGANIKF